jgi:hypothetical protein
MQAWINAEPAGFTTAKGTEEQRKARGTEVVGKSVLCSSGFSLFLCTPNPRFLAARTIFPQFSTFSGTSKEPLTWMTGGSAVPATCPRIENEKVPCARSSVSVVTVSVPYGCE